MPHSIFDERGELLHQVGSDIAAFWFCLQRQKIGKLTTMLTSEGGEIMFAPIMPGGQKRAETALEYKTRTNTEDEEAKRKARSFLQSFEVVEDETLTTSMEQTNLSPALKLAGAISTE